MELSSREVGGLNGGIRIAAPRIVDEDVDAARLRQHLAACLLAGRGVGDVAAWVHTLRPSARTSSAVLSSCSAFRPLSTTSAPASAAASAITRPKPRLPPVMKMRLPSSRKRSSTLMWISLPDRSAVVRAASRLRRRTMYLGKIGISASFSPGRAVIRSRNTPTSFCPARLATTCVSPPMGSTTATVASSGRRAPDARA